MPTIKDLFNTCSFIYNNIAESECHYVYITNEAMVSSIKQTGKNNIDTTWC